MVSETKKKTNKLWREKNKEHLKSYNKKKYKEYSADPKFRKEAIIRSNKWAKENKEKRNASVRKHAKTPKGIFATVKSNAKKRGIKCNLTQQEFIDWYMAQDKKCLYCGIYERELTKLYIISKNILKHIKRLTIDRINNNASYCINNICLCCALCNRIKSDVFTKEEMLYIGKNFLTPKLNV